MTSATGVVAGLKDASPAGISMTSAPQSDPWLQAPGGAYSWLIRSEMSCPAARAVYAKPRKACLIETTYDPAGNVVPDHTMSAPVRPTSTPLSSNQSTSRFASASLRWTPRFGETWSAEPPTKGMRNAFGYSTIQLCWASVKPRPATSGSSQQFTRAAPATPRRKISSWSARMAARFSIQKSADE